MAEKMTFGRYDWAGFSSYVSYAICSLGIPLMLVEMGKSLNFPLDEGGMASGGLLHMARSFAMVLALLICGFIAGRIGKRKTMGLSMLMMGGGILVCSISPVYGMLFPFLLIAGFGEGLCEGAGTPFAEGLHPDEPERYVSVFHSMWSVGTASCVVLAGTLLTLGVHWRYILALFGFLGLFSAALFLWKENPKKKYPESAHADSVSDILRYSVHIAKVPRFWIYSLGMALGAGPEFCLTFWASSYLRLSFGASALLGGCGTGAIAGGMFLGRLLFGYYAKKQYLKHILLFCSLGTIPLSLLLVFVNPAVFPSRILLFTYLLVILFFCGIGIAPYWPVLQVYGVNNLPKLDSTMLYIYFSALGSPGCGFFTWFMGVLGDRYGLQGAFMLIPGSLLLFALLVFLEGWVFPCKEEQTQSLQSGSN